MAYGIWHMEKQNASLSYYEHGVFLKIELDSKQSTGRNLSCFLLEPGWAAIFHLLLCTLCLLATVCNMSMIYSGESDSAVQCAYIETCKGEGSSKGKVAYRGGKASSPIASRIVSHIGFSCACGGGGRLSVCLLDVFVRRSTGWRLFPFGFPGFASVRWEEHMWQGQSVMRRTQKKIFLSWRSSCGQSSSSSNIKTSSWFVIIRYSSSVIIIRHKTIKP